MACPLVIAVGTGMREGRSGIALRGGRRERYISREGMYFGIDRTKTAQGKYCTLFRQPLPLYSCII